MRIVIDLDGVICSLKHPGESYRDVRPNLAIIKMLRGLKDDGHYIIINTARHMRSCEGNVGKVVARVGEITLKWLRKYNVPFDEINFGKPYADIYIDDMNVVYSSPQQLRRDIKSVMPNFIIPMAGKGKRFLDAGYKIPKYMIKACSLTLLEWSLKSLPLDLANKLIFICLREHEKKYNVSQFINEIIETQYPFLKNKYLIIFLNKITRGQAETVLKAKKYINSSIPLIVYNTDTYFYSSRLRQKIISMKNKKIDGMLGVFHDNDPKWSFIKLNNKGFVQRTAEKKPISNIASTGLYVFREGKLFVEAAEYTIRKNLKVNNEFYVAPLYNILIKRKKKIIVDFVEKFWCLGTPEDLKYFTKNYKE